MARAKTYKVTVTNLWWKVEIRMPPGHPTVGGIALDGAVIGGGAPSAASVSLVCPMTPLDGEGDEDAFTMGSEMQPDRPSDFGVDYTRDSVGPWRKYKSNRRLDWLQ
jgi:hypothetical protein